MMKRLAAVIIIIGLLFSVYAEVSRPSLDGRAKVADVGELPVGLFAKSASFLPGDTVIVTNPATKISIEVMIFGNIGSSEGIAVVLSPEAARELYITKGSNVIVQVTKKSDTYVESSILSKTLQNYTPVEEKAEEEEPLFDTPSETVDEDYYFFDDPNAVIEKEASEVVIDEEPVFVTSMDDSIEAETEIGPEEEVAFEEPEWPAEVVETEPEPVEPEEDVAFEEPEWPAEVVETEPEPVEPEEEVVFEEPEWPAELVETEPEPVEPEEEVAFEEPEWPAEVVETEPEPVEPEEEVAFEEPVWPEDDAVIEYVEIIDEPEVNENFIEEVETILVPAEPNPPTYESIIMDEPEVVIIPVFEEETEPEVIEEEIVEEIIPVVEDEPEVVVMEEEPVVEPVVEEPVVEEIPAVSDVDIPYGEIQVGNWYIQIATCSKIESVENIVREYGKKYPLVVVKTASGDMRVLVGSLSSDEYPTILARFKSLGFKDAFPRNK